MDHLWRLTDDGAYIRPDGRVFVKPGGSALRRRTAADYRAASVVTIKPCESTRGEWGQRCPDCHRMLPARQGPLRSWKAIKHLGGSSI